MPVIDRRVRTQWEIRNYNYRGLTQAGSGTGNFYLLDSMSNFGNITVELASQSGIGYAGLQDAGDNKEVSYAATQYTVNGQDPTSENVIVE